MFGINKIFIPKSIFTTFGLILIMGFFSPLKSTHIVGGDITYKCLGENDTYEITLTVRRDCQYGADNAPFDSPLYLTIFNGENQFMHRRGDNGYIFMEFLGQDTLQSDLDSDCVNQGGPVCVHEAIYKGRVILPFESSGYTLAYQRCCRNQTLNNIIDPLTTGATYYTHISSSALEQCNNSPVFKDWPPIYICADRQLYFDHSATDKEGDELVYELCTPSQGATINKPKPTKTSSPPFDTVIWKAPYSLANVLGGDALTIDPNTGIITAKPNLIGQFLVGVCVKEYRNGQLISTTRRDFEFNVRPCADKPIPDFEVTSELCDGLEVKFKNTSINGLTYTWYFDSDNDRSLTSNEKDPVFKYDKPGTYRVVLIANNQQCLDSISKIINVIDPNIVADFTYDLACKNEIRLILDDASTANGVLVQWDWKVTEGARVYLDSTQHVEIDLEKGGDIEVELTVIDSNGCEASIKKEISLPTVSLKLIGDSLSLCQGDSTKLLIDGNKDYTYTWDPTTYLNFNPPHDPTAIPLEDITYRVTVTNDTCSLIDSIFIMVRDSFEVTIEGRDTTCDGKVILIAKSDSTDIFEWSLDPDFSVIIGTGDTLIYTIDKTTRFYVRAGGEDDCRGSNSILVEYGVLDVIIKDIYILCDGGGFLTLNEGGDSTLIYNWTPGGILDDSTKYNPTGEFLKTTFLKVIVYDPNFPKCRKIFEVEVRVSIPIEITGLPRDTVLCNQDSLKLKIDLNIIPKTIIWTDEQGKVVGTGYEVIITPPDSGWIYVFVTDSLGCEASDSIFIRNYTLDIIIVYPNQACVGDSICFEVTNKGLAKIEVTWTVEDQLMIGEKICFFPRDKNGKYKIRIDYGDGCIFTQILDIVIYGIDEINATADPVRLELGRTVQLDVDATGADVYKWSPEGIIDDPTIRNPIAKPDSVGIHRFIVKVTDVNGCMAWDTVEVEVIPLDCNAGVFIPNVFSPNGDGLNDELFVRSNVILDMELIIFNRWGQEVFKTTDQNIGWDGNYNGTQLGPDVFNYHLIYSCIDEASYSKSGNVTLLR